MHAWQRGRGLDQHLAAPRGGRSALVQHEWNVGRDPQMLAQACAPVRGQCADVTHHARPAEEAVALAQALCDALGDCYDSCAAGHHKALNACDECGPQALPVGHARGQLMRVVYQPRPGEPRADDAWQQHRRVVGVHDVGSHTPDAGDEGPQEGRSVEVEGQTPAQPCWGQNRAAREAIQEDRRPAHPSMPSRPAHLSQLQYRHLVARAGERGCLATHARVELHRLVQQHRDAHGSGCSRATGRGV